MKRLHPAFTLLELLVVIAIIGILVTMGAVAFTTAQVKARDARRKADLDAMQKAQEQYYADNTGYLVWGDQTCSGAIGTNMDSVPTDPRNSGSYVYNCKSTANAYCITATLEDTPGNCSGCSLSGGVYTFDTSDDDQFCVKNLQ